MSWAYNHIYNNWFRRQDLIDSVEVPKDDGADSVGIFNLLRRSKRQDYFTSCQPWPQKNNVGLDITIPLGERAPIAADPSGASDSLTIIATIPAAMDSSGPLLEVGTGQSDGRALYADLTPEVQAVNEIAARSDWR